MEQTEIRLLKLSPRSSAMALASNVSLVVSFNVDNLMVLSFYERLICPLSWHSINQEPISMGCSQPPLYPEGKSSNSADGSAIVEMSPNSKSFVEAFRKILRIVLPDLVLGSCFRHLILSGDANGPILWRTGVRNDIWNIWLIAACL